jgi:endonuclease-3
MLAPDWKLTFQKIREAVGQDETPSLNVLLQEGSDAFQILVATILSLRTRDEVTLKASRALFSRAKTPEELLKLSETELSDLIFPVGFYKTKAHQLLEISKILVRDFQSNVPKEQEVLLQLPGVGPKTANLVIGLAFGTPSICVDTHVHRISNRLGWVETTEPAQTEKSLEVLLPREAWIEINEVFVLFGQNICVPASPRCSECPLKEDCPRRGVVHSR